MVLGLGFKVSGLGRGTYSWCRVFPCLPRGPTTEALLLALQLATTRDPKQGFSSLDEPCV